VPYLRGFTDGFGAALIGLNDSKQVAFCPPKEVTVSQMAKVVVKFGNDHPEKLSMPAFLFTLVTLREAYPYQAN
jgi:hypothetical protein